MGALVLLCPLLILATVAHFNLAGAPGLWLRYSYFTGPCVIGGVYYCLFRRPRPLATPALMGFLLLLCLLVLYGMWEAGLSDFHMIGGLLPYFDAKWYLTDALRLLHGQRFSTISSRRPLFSALLTALLYVTDGNLPLVLIALTLLSGAAIGLVVREVQRSAGSAAGMWMLLCLFLFYRRFIGATLTEQLGLPLGCLAFCLLWRGAMAARSDLAMAGVFVLSLALNARAGAFLVLPAVVLWSARIRSGPRRQALKIILGGTVAAAGGFAVNGLILHLVGIPSAAFSNFAYVLYGLVFGGDWTLAMRQHPELAGLPDLDQTRHMLGLAIAEIRAHPIVLLTGCVRAWSDFFFAAPGGWFSFLQYRSPEWATFREAGATGSLGALSLFREAVRLLDTSFQTVWIVALNVLAGAGAVVAWLNRRSAPAGLLIAVGVGILLSVPFAPPWDADNMRAYAATMPFVISFPMLGLLSRPGSTRHWGERATEPEAGACFDVALLGGAVSGLILLASIGMQAGLFRPPQAGVAACVAECEGGRRAVTVRTHPHMAVRLWESSGENERGRPGNPVNLDELRARTVLKSTPDVWHMWRGLTLLEGGTTIALLFDVRHGTTFYAQFQTAEFPRVQQVARVCGDVVRQEWIEWLRVKSLSAC
ncbi:MAG: hypothetical protein NTW68_00865 [candidate division NC10 bacterium]|nr:hypothetical protein [candidate division NC10 bacterium]